CGHCCEIPRQAAWRNDGFSLVRDDEIVRIVDTTRIRREPAPVGNHVARLHRRWLQRRTEMSVIHPAGRTATCRLPLPVVHITGPGEMATAAYDAARRGAHGQRACLAGSVPPKSRRHSGQVPRQAVLVEDLLADDIIAVG